MEGDGRGGGSVVESKKILKRDPDVGIVTRGSCDWQVTTHKLFFNVSMQTSVDVPRIYHKLVPNVLRYERGFSEVHDDSSRDVCRSVSLSLSPF